MRELIRGAGANSLSGFDIGHDLARHIHDDERIKVDIGLLADFIGLLFADRLRSANAHGRAARAQRQKREAENEL